jgi:hypothetical protein
MWGLIRFFSDTEACLALDFISEKAQEELINTVEDEIEKKSKSEAKKLGRRLTREESKKIVKEAEADFKTLHEYLSYQQSSQYHQEVIINRKDLVYHYLFVCNPRLARANKQADIDDKLANIEFREMRIEINSILESCIDESNGYIKKHPSSDLAISLTGKGKKFASIDGLIREEIKSFGVIWSVTVGVIVGASSGFAANGVGEFVGFVWHFLTTNG